MTDADEEIRRCIDQNKSFVLDAGAGSGKTSSLVLALRYLIDSQTGSILARRSQRVACITFTNVAKDEIIDRTARSELVHVSTIHDFLWSVIKPYQKAIKRALLKHNRNLKTDSTRRRDETELTAALRNVDVTYSDMGAEFIEGRMFHDDLLSVALWIFEENPLMSRILAARYPYIFVDEYQDTSESVIDILVDHVLKANQSNLLIGFFGDKFQHIYHGGEHPGVGEIKADHQKLLLHIAKQENYRCSKAVIALLNRIRTDITQFPAADNVDGSAVYIRLARHDGDEDVLERAREFARHQMNWDLSVGTQEELFLTHKLIAKKAGYEELLDIYQKRGGIYRERFLRGEEEIIAFFRASVEPLIVAWRNGQIGKFLSILRANGFKLEENKGKARARSVGQACHIAHRLYSSRHPDSSRRVRSPDLA